MGFLRWVFFGLFWVGFSTAHPACTAPMLLPIVLVEAMGKSGERKPDVWAAIFSNSLRGIRVIIKIHIFFYYFLEYKNSSQNIRLDKRKKDFQETEIDRKMGEKVREREKIRE